MKGFCLEVWGDYACFTRPEMKVERVSYDVITPSAARAIFESILWKPAIFWNIKKIEVLNPIKWISVRRNEVGAVASDKKDCIYAEDNRQQRAGLFLKDVKYRIVAEFELIPREKILQKQSRNVLYEHTMKKLLKENPKRQECETPAKYAAMFERRAQNGQCFNQPYLGCREFSANFKLVNREVDKTGIPINETKEFGLMLYDLDFTNLKSPQPMWFFAKMKNGVIEIPDWNSKEVLR
uniref:pre-crRNA processing endonuclease n=1 Tax=Candidatus Endomicrobium sp. MdMp-027 TaxID=1837116 RepID=A0A1C9ZYJ6_9BACT|nr:CRISPR-associated protein Cas5 [Candidatus Endomicrobium sp. MdMp-027]